VPTAAEHDQVVIFAVSGGAWDDVVSRTGPLAETVVVAARDPLGFDATGPTHDGRGTGLQLAGDDPDARETVAALARGMGVDPVDAGPLRNAALLENLAVLRIHLAIKGGYGREVGFRLLRD